METIIDLVTKNVSPSEVPKLILNIAVFYLSALLAIGATGYIKKSLVLFYLPWFDREKGNSAKTHSLFLLVGALVGFGYLIKTEPYLELIYSNMFSIVLTGLVGILFGYAFHQLLDKLFPSLNIDRSKLILFGSVKLIILLLPLAYYLLSTY